MSDDEIDATPHGAGENFPLDDGGEELDSAPADNKRDPIDRRVELFFFDPEFGISPQPPGQISKAGSTEYPAWRKRVSEVIELRADELDGPKVIFIELADAHFRTNSAVVLPEGENPDQTGSHQAITSVGIIATVLRFNEEHPGRTLLVAGHADTTNTPEFNQPLSEERAQLTLALLEGGDDSRETFKKLAQGRHTVGDIKQILSWAAEALDGFDCDPGSIDDNAATLNGPVRKFQTAYNDNLATIAPNSAPLVVDGSVGPNTWGAIFDCYEFALQGELGEDAAGVQALRDKLQFVDPDHKFLGFSEYFPIEELGVDNFRSQTNRRVEIHFFEQGEEPDIQHAADDPETSDLYLPGHYERTPLEPMVSAKPWTASFDALTACMHQSRQLQLNAPGLPAGVPMTFAVLVFGGLPLTTVEGVSTEDNAAAAFEDWDAPDDVPFGGDLSAGQPFPIVNFEFEVSGGGRLIKSQAPLIYADVLNVQLVANVNGATPVLADQPYVINTLWGRRSGTTDAQGLLDEQGLPPGGITLALRDRFLVGTDPLPFGWDRDDT